MMISKMKTEMDEENKNISIEKQRLINKINFDKKK